MKCNIREEQREDCREMDSIMRIPSAVLLCAVKCFGLGFSLSGVRREISRSLPPAYYMCNNVNYSHCYRFLMYFSNFIFYVQVIFSDIFFCDEAHYTMMMMMIFLHDINFSPPASVSAHSLYSDLSLSHRERCLS